MPTKSVAKPATKQPAAARLRASQFIRWLPAVIAIGLIAYSLIGLFDRYQTTHSSHPLPANQTVVVSTDKPDETVIPPGTTYQVPADQPKYISLPSIKAAGFVQRVGIDQKGAVAVPSNVNLAGWFVGKATPGKQGLSVIDGHVQGHYSPGIFKDLSKLKSGEKFEITFGDGKTKHFEVMHVRSYPVATAAEQLFKKDVGIESQLNLVTCGGSYNRASQQYDERVLVTSKYLP